MVTTTGEGLGNSGRKGRIGTYLGFARFAFGTEARDDFTSIIWKYYCCNMVGIITIIIIINMVDVICISGGIHIDINVDRSYNTLGRSSKKRVR